MAGIRDQMEVMLCANLNRLSKGEGWEPESDAIPRLLRNMFWCPTSRVMIRRTLDRSTATDASCRIYTVPAACDR